LGIHALTLDVTSQDSIDLAAREVASRSGRLDVLVNNAGYGQFGAVTDLPPEALRRQFDTNVIAPVQVARAFLPLMLPQKNGCIANIGSVSGILTTPFAGAYCASKAALHALSDAMRMELAPFGIRVVTVQPGSVSSNIGETGTEFVSLPDGSIFEPLARAIRARANASQKGAMQADEFAKELVSSLLSADPPATFRAAPYSVQFPFLKWSMPTRVLDRKLSKAFGLDRLRDLAG
jgi:NAD(P)-dependent dehydrogenase (short-subunit alcohol dehydrogenase family)